MLLLFYGAGFYYLVKGIPGLGYSRQTELVPVGWRDLGGQIERIAAAIPGQQPHGVLIVGMDRYAIASELAFYSSDQSRSVADTSSGHLFGGMGLMYEQWFPAPQQSGRTLLLVSFDAASLDATQLMRYVERLDPMHEGTLLRGGRFVRRYYYRVAYAYRPSDAK